MPEVKKEPAADAESPALRFARLLQEGLNWLEKHPEVVKKIDAIVEEERAREEKMFRSSH